MKRFFHIVTFQLLAICAFAQVPQKFNYQAVARDAQGAVLPNQTVTVRASILDGSPSGSAQYSEAHSTITNPLGLFSLAIGGGSVLSGNFGNISWADGNKYLKIEMDPSGGNNFTLVGSSQLLSVPYAVFAEKTRLESGTGIAISNNTISNTGDLDDTNELQFLSLAGDTLQISEGNRVKLPVPPAYAAGQGIQISGNTISNTGDNDNSSSNELQQLSLAGNTVSLSNGGSINLPTPAAGAGISVNNWQISNTGDLSNTNEIQSLTLNGNTLSLSQNGGTVTLPSGTPSQWTTTGSNIYYSAGNVGIGQNAPSEKLHLGGKMKIDGANTLEFGAGVAGKQSDAGKIGYQTYTTGALDIIGAGTTGANRKLKIWNEGGAIFAGNIGIKTTADPVSPLTFSNDLGNKLSIFYSSATSQYGIGLQTALLQFYCGASTDNIAFGYGSSTAFSEVMRIKGSGNIGIGTTNPTSKLHVNGNLRVENDLSLGGTSLVNVDAAGVTGGRFKIAADGKVSLGNPSTPGSYRLYVADGILAERVKVALKSTAYWADYVFAPDYNLMPLGEVETFVQANRHLPNVPSAAQVVAEGIDVATMDAKLLEKIEELTLYLIDLKKENEALKARIENLENGKR